MGWLSNLISNVTPKAAAPADNTGAGYAYLWNADTQISPDVDQANYLLAYQVSLWTQRCIQAIAQACASVPIELVDTESGDKVETHPALDTLRYVNVTDDQPWLIAATVGYQLLSGDAYWRLDEAKNPKVIWQLRPDRVKARTKGGFAYEYKVGSVTEVIPPELVIHFRNWNPVNDFHGQSTMQPAETSINLDKAIREFNANFMRNSAVPAGLLSAEGNLDDDARKAAKESWQANYVGGRNAGKTAILIGGKWSWQQLGNLNKDGSYIELAKLMREEILATFGVPPVVVGLLEYASYANAAEQKRLFWGDTIIAGHMKQLLGRLNQAYLPRWEDAKRYEFRVDESQVAALQEDRNMVAARLQPAVGVPYMTVNEAREEVGLDPVDGGDVVMQPFSVAPLGTTLALPQNNPAEEVAEAQAAAKVAVPPFGSRQRG